MRDPRPEHRHASVLSVLATLVLASIAACGGGGGDDDDDDGPPDAADPVIICGNEIVDPGEDCDDGNTEPDIVCDGECHTSCGNGSIEPGELCDTAGSGDELCPSAAGDCDDTDACTQDQLVGA